MSNVVLHIGLHKTATGTLQRQYFPACNDLRLFTTRDQNMRMFVEMVNKTDPIYFSPNDAKKVIESEFAANMPNMLSNESFSGPPYAGVIEAGLDHRSAIIKNLSTVFPEAKVILIIRRQDALARSLYRQYLKSGGTRKIRRFYGLEDEPKYPLMSLNRFYFSKYVDTVKNAFPNGLLILPYEKFVDDQQLFLQKINNFIGISPPDIELKRENASSLGPFGMELSRILNHIFRSLLNPAGIIPGIAIERGGVRRRISPVQYLHDKFPFKSKHNNENQITTVAREILNAAQEDNKILDEKYNLQLKKYNYY